MVNGKPILVTGAGGFIGANLCRYLAAMGERVVGVESPQGAPWRLDGGSGIERIRADLLEASDIARVVEHARPKAIAHCAAYGAYSNQTDADQIYRINVDAVRHLLDAARRCGITAFIQSGTSSEYGFNCTAPNEESETIPDSHYAVSKVAATALTRFYGRHLGLPVCTFRLYSVYGPYEDTSRLIPKLLSYAARGAWPPLVNPNISRDFVYIDDVSRAFASLLLDPSSLRAGEIYNVGSGTKTTLHELVSLTRDLFNVGPKPEWGSMTDRAWDHPDWVSNSAKAKRELGWEATTSLAEGLVKTMAWMRNNSAVFETGDRASVINRART